MKLPRASVPEVFKFLSCGQLDDNKEISFLDNHVSIFRNHDRVFACLWFLFMSPLLFCIKNSLFLQIASSYIGFTERAEPP